MIVENFSNCEDAVASDIIRTGISNKKGYVHVCSLGKIFHYHVFYHEIRITQQVRANNNFFLKKRLHIVHLRR